MAGMAVAEKQSVAPEIRIKPPGPKAQAVLARDREWLAPSMTRAYPLVVDRGQGHFVWDVDGNRYLDFTSGVGVNVLGHSHPDIVQAVTRQAKEFMHMCGTDFYYDLMPRAAEALARTVPGDFKKKVFWTNSGAEAIEAGLKLARYATRRPRFLAFIGAFHGRTMGSLSLTASKAVQREHFSPLLPEVTHVPYAYCYRCVYNTTPDRCGMYCANIIEDLYFARVAPPSDIAAIIVEPVQGEGGYVVPPKDFLVTLRRICDRHGILLMVDEVQSGMGRTGKMWAIEHSGVVPDILCTSKALGNGLPVGAMVARADLHTWGPGAHANTFGGNPLALAAVLKTLELVQTKYLKQAASMGEYLAKRLDDLVRKYDIAGDHRGLGLMRGVEIVQSKKTRAPARDLRDQLVSRCFENGLLLLGCGDSSIRFLPAISVEREHIDCAVEIFEKAVKSL